MVLFEKRRENFCISTDPAHMDIRAMHAFLSQAYWSENIPMDIIAKAVENSLCFGLFDGQRQIGLARVITDKATFAYLCDVYVLEEYRGRGLGKWLMECVQSHPELQNLRRFVLLTKDAHGLYEQFGFAPPKDPKRYMEIARPDIYKRR